MELFFSPMACSLAARIALYEAGQNADFTPVTLSTKRTGDDRDFWQVNAKGKVPVLRLDDGTLLTEVPAVLQYIADLAPASGLMPAAGTPAHYQTVMWLTYVATELHKQVFAQIFTPDFPAEVKANGRRLLESRLDHLNANLEGRETLVDGGFTVADAYLMTALNWCRAIKLRLDPWPALKAYQARHMQRPAVARATAEEFALYQAA
jgi:glutathione S-transferase